MYSAFCLYGTAGPKSQEFWRKAANTGFGKHSKIRWCTKVVKWHSWGTEHSSTMPTALEKTEEWWRNGCKRNDEGGNAFSFTHVRQCLPKVLQEGFKCQDQKKQSQLAATDHQQCALHGNEIPETSYNRIYCIIPYNNLRFMLHRVRSYVGARSRN